MEIIFICEGESQLNRIFYCTTEAMIDDYFTILYKEFN